MMTSAVSAASPATGAGMEPPESVGFVREPGAIPPDYVCDSAMGVAVDSIFFTLEIEHNGFFCGPSNKLEYFGATLEILDYCSAANLSYSVLQEHLKWLGYGVDEQNMYWCRPRHELSDGLVHIRGDGSYILDAREMAVLSMLENIFYKLMHRMMIKQREAMEKWTGNRVCPKILKKLEKNTAYAANCHVSPAGQELFRVQSGNSSYLVDLCLHKCECRRWQLSGVPCGHSIACMREERINPEDMVHDCYTVQTYLRAYGYTLAPLRDPKDWEKIQADKVYPPVFTKQVGRPKKNRKQAPEEKIKGGVRYLNKKGVTMHCSICGKPDHNRKGHYKYQEALLGGGYEIDENYDDPSFLQNIFPGLANHMLDPSQQPQSMVFNMAQRERSFRAPHREHGPLPQQSSFVAAAGDSIPQPRVITTEMNIGRSTRATRRAETGEGSQHAARGNKRQRGAGRGAADIAGTSAAAARGRGVGRGRNSGRTAGGRAGRGAGRGRGAHYLLFGDDRATEIPDLNL